MYLPKSSLFIRNAHLQTNLSSLSFSISKNDIRYEYKCETQEVFDTWIQALSKLCIRSMIVQNYKFGKMLGKGNSSKVYLGINLSNNKKYAIKIIYKHKISKSNTMIMLVQNEIDILRKLRHPYIINLHEVYENEYCIYLVMEYLEGGELLYHLETKGTYSEREASMLIKCILKALKYCHSKNIIHRDLKPENLLLM